MISFVCSDPISARPRAISRVKITVKGRNESSMSYRTVVLINSFMSVDADRIGMMIARVRRGRLYPFRECVKKALERNMMMLSMAHVQPVIKMNSKILMERSPFCGKSLIQSIVLRAEKQDRMPECK